LKESISLIFEDILFQVSGPLCLIDCFVRLILQKDGKIWEQLLVFQVLDKKINIYFKTSNFVSIQN